MELKAGYKQTEIGFIPQDWEALPASQIGRFRGGAGFPLSHQGSREGDFPFYKVSDMNNDGNEIFMAASSNWISEDVRRKIAARVFPAGSIVFAKVGAAIFLERKKILSRPSCIDNNMAAFVINDEHASVRFFHSQLLAMNFGDLVATTALPSLSGKVLGEMVLAVPPIPEQSAIANALSDVDALLAAQDALIAKKRAIKQGAMQELLTGKRRLPGFTGEWKNRPLSNFVTGERFAIVDGPFGSQLKVSEFVESGVPVIEMEHLRDDFIAEETFRCITWSKFEDLKRSAVYPGDIVVSKTGSLGKLGLVPDTLPRGLITSRLAKISIAPSLADRRFVFHVLSKLREDGYWMAVSQGGTMQILGIGMLKNAPVPAISVTEQAAIAAVLSDMDTEIMALESQRTKTAQLKQGMMQALLTGRIRLV